MKVIFTEMLGSLKKHVALYNVELKDISLEDIEKLRKLTSKMKEYERSGYKLSANQLLIDFIGTLIQNDKEVLASLLTNEVAMVDRREDTDEDTEEMEDGFYKAGYAAKRLGVSTQTLRRYCESGRISGAKKTPGGHWRIPKNSFRVSEEQYDKAEETLKKIDKINQDAGEVENEFNL